MTIRSYKDFHIRIDPEPRRGKGYPISIIKSPAGESPNEIYMLLPVEHSPLVDNLVALRNGKYDEQWLKSLGKELFKTIFLESKHPTNKQYRGEIDRLFSSSLTMATTMPEGNSIECGLRIRLNIIAPELQHLPWELLIRPDEFSFFLSNSPATPIVRHIAFTNNLKQSLRITPPLRVLLIVTDSQHANFFQTVKTTIYNALHSLGQNAEITSLENPSLDEIRHQVSLGNHHILHIEGSVVLSDNEKPYLSIQDNDHLDSELLATYLQSSSIRLVILNASGTASEFGPAIIYSGVPAVIAMQAQITRMEAEEFASSFYKTLAEVYPIELAVCEARKALFGRSDTKIGHWKPVLFMTTDEGYLFNSADLKRDMSRWDKDERDKIRKYRENILEAQEILKDIRFKRGNQNNKDVDLELEEEENFYNEKIRNWKAELIALKAYAFLPDSNDTSS